jgi:hemerythrin-like domain-containing protein
LSDARFLDARHGATEPRIGCSAIAIAIDEEPPVHATQILSSEHRVIESVIAALDAAAQRLEAGGPMRPAFFVDAVRFIADFADGYHHCKEEGVLFEAMARNGMPNDGGPIAVMLYEHERARELTAALRKAASAFSEGDRDAADSVVVYARAYGELLTQHIYKEDNILFPMADQVIVPQDQDSMLSEFERVEAERASKGSKASYLDLARALCAEVGLDADAAPRRAVELPCHAR